MSLVPELKSIHTFSTQNLLLGTPVLLYYSYLTGTVVGAEKALPIYYKSPRPPSRSSSTFGPDLF